MSGLRKCFREKTKGEYWFNISVKRFQLTSDKFEKEEETVATMILTSETLSHKYFKNIKNIKP